MAVDGEHHGDEDEEDMLPDEATVLPERGEALEEADDEDLLSVDEVAEELDIDLDDE